MHYLLSFVFGKKNNPFELECVTAVPCLTSGVKQHPALKRAVTFKLAIGVPRKTAIVAHSGPILQFDQFGLCQLALCAALITI